MSHQRCEGFRDVPFVEPTAELRFPPKLTLFPLLRYSPRTPTNSRTKQLLSTLTAPPRTRTNAVPKDAHVNANIRPKDNEYEAQLFHARSHALGGAPLHSATFANAVRVHEACPKKATWAEIKDSRGRGAMSSPRKKEKQGSAVPRGRASPSSFAGTAASAKGGRPPLDQRAGSVGKTWSMASHKQRMAF